METKPPEAQPVASRAIVPEVIGLDVPQAQVVLEGAGLRMRVEGHGTAISQDVAPNTVVEQGAEIVVRFAP